MATIFPSNLEYLGNKPNFTRDSFDTLAAMKAALEAGHIDEGHLSYCKETGVTYKATRSGDNLVWKDTIGDLKDELEGIISDNETVISEALYDLNNRLGRVEREVTYVDDDPGIPNTQTRLDDVWEWFDKMTHIPVLTSKIEKVDTDNLRGGTNHTYKAVFNWDWASRVGVTGFKVNNGTDWSDLIPLSNPNMAGGVQESTIYVPLGTTPKTLRAKYVISEGVDYPEAGSVLTVTPLTESRTFVSTGLPRVWTSYTPSTKFTMTITATGKNLSSYAAGDKIKVDGELLEEVAVVTDADYVVTNDKPIIPISINTYRYTWESSDGTYLVTTDFSPSPSFLLVSATKNAWNKTASGLATMSLSTKYISYLDSTPTTSPTIDFSAGSTMIYLSPLDNRGMTVKSQAQGSSDWVTINGFSESGTVSYMGKTYYYMMNPNVGAGIFKFNFS